MEALEAIYLRQSIPKVKPDPVPRPLVERLLDAAVQAPNHHRTRPWRFVVLTGEARNRLGEVMAQAYQNREPDVMEQALDVERARPLRAPVLIAVGVDRPENEKVVEVENIAAAAAAVQNLLIAATQLGLAAMWRTGSAAYDPDVKCFLGFSPDQHLIGFIYIGYPETERPPKERPSASDRITWME
jgi:nitroreductase